MLSAVTSSDCFVVRGETFLQHSAGPSHPENPGRLAAIQTLFEERPDLAAIPVLPVTAASEAELLRLHARDMVRRVLANRGASGWYDGDTYYSPASSDVAALAAGACIQGALAVFRGESRRGFCLVRPPGHHAIAARPMGFCLFNNVALAAAAVLAEAPAARIAIVDFDLHHGNGTQELFYDDERVLFVSSHRYPFYPGTGALDEIGRGKGKGTTVNFPMAEPRGDEVFLPLYGDIVAAIVREFAPDLILVSAGFDGHVSDPMQGFRLRTGTYGYLAETLIALAEERAGKILFCLEGGYHPAALKASVAEVLDRMLVLPRARFSARPAPGGDDEILDSFRSFHRGQFRAL